jgi:hypothetical protein
MVRVCVGYERFFDRFQRIYKEAAALTAQTAVVHCNEFHRLFSLLTMTQ